MSKQKKNTLSDLNEFLKYSQNNSNSETKNEITKETSFVEAQPHTLVAVESIKKNSPKVSKISPGEPLTSPRSEELIFQNIQNLADEQGISPERILSNLMQRNVAQASYERFLLTDLMIKGSFLLFNFWLLVKETQKTLTNEENLNS